MRSVLIAFLILCSSLSAQQWPLESSRWIYSYVQPGMWGTYEIMVDGDTIIEGVSCHKVVMNRVANWCLNADCDVYTTQSGFDDFAILYQSNDSVLSWDSEEFRLLYDFGAQVSDQWLAHITEFETNCNDSAVVEVTGIGTMDVNGIERRYIDLETISNAQIGLSGRAVEGIGLIESGLDLYGANAFLPGVLDCPGGWIYDGDDTQFSCYYDDEVGVYGSSACDFLNVAEEVKLDLVLSPNPVRHRLTVAGLDGYALGEFEVFDLSGRSMNCPRIQGNGLELDTSKLEEGTYILRWTIEGASQSQAFIKLD